MQSFITDDLELVLRWHDNGESTVRFALVSSSEFTISCHVCWNSGLNYQGEATTTFQTMCYGHDLSQFAVELEKLSQGSSVSVRFINTASDFEIRIAPIEREGRRVLLSEVLYRHFRLLDGVACKSELVLPVGIAAELGTAAKTINEQVRLLKMDCRSLFELPK